ncbi:hypothetical protein D3C71_1759050 [compost metagenome]
MASPPTLPPVATRAPSSSRSNTSTKKNQAAIARPEARVRSCVSTDSSTAMLKKASPSSTELIMKPP